MRLEFPMASNSSAGECAEVSDRTSRLDRDLIAIGTSSDKAAFQRLFKDLSPRVRSFLLGQGLSAAMCEDVLQETFLKVWRKADLYDPGKSSAVTWVFAIARNARIDRLRKEMAPVPDMTDPSMEQEAPETGEQIINRKDDINKIRSAMTVLSKEQMDIISMSFFEEKSHGTIAYELDLPLGTVKSRIRLAFRKIRSELEKVQ